MSNGALVTLAAIGVQNGHLTIDPETSFFKNGYKRHSHFSTEYIENELKHEIHTVSRNGDLMGETCYSFNLSTQTYQSDEYLLGFIDTIKLDIGNAIVAHFNKFSLYTNLLMNKQKIAQNIQYNEKGNIVLNCRIPLIWETHDFIPLICLAYHEVRVNVKKQKQFIQSESEKLSVNFKRLPREIVIKIYSFVLAFQMASQPCNYKMGTEYIFLDTQERRLFAQNSHEILCNNYYHSVEFVKEPMKTEVSCMLNFNHPTKYIIFFVNEKSNTLVNKETIDPIIGTELLINDRHSKEFMDVNYLRVYRPKQLINRELPIGMYMVPFCLKPDKVSPSGSFNLSRINNLRLKIKFPPTKKKYYINVVSNYHNVLRIQAGMGGLKFAN